MPRYFKTTNATRPYKAGGLSFEFEPVELLGGSAWLGVLAAEEPAASILAGARFAQVTEITESDYGLIKKKIQERERELQQPTPITASRTPESGCRSCGKHPYSVKQLNMQ